MSGVDGRVMRILHVEDEQTNRSLLRAVLVRSNDRLIREAELVEATTIAEARQRLAERGADVVLLDVRLPDGSGLDLARELVAARSNGSAPRVVALSAGVLPGEQAAALRAGCDAFLGKPYRPTELLAVLSEAVQARAAGVEDEPAETAAEQRPASDVEPTRAGAEPA